MSERPVALVTGANRGIGLAIARELAEAGYRTALLARDRQRLDQACQSIADLGGEAIAVAADLRAADAAAAAVEQVRARLGPIAVLVNNAGTAPSDRIDNTTDAMLQAAFELHVRAPLQLLRACLPDLRAQPAAAMVNVASTAGLRGFPFTAAYTAAKHGMVGLTRAVAAELQPTAIRVYAVCPGFVDTDITRTAAEAIAARGKLTAEQALQRLGAQNRIGRMHRPEEVALAVLWLVRERPPGCVYDLDRAQPTCVDQEQP